MCELYKIIMKSYNTYTTPCFYLCPGFSKDIGFYKGQDFYPAPFVHIEYSDLIMIIITIKAAMVN